MTTERYKMSDDALREFVSDFCSGHIITTETEGVGRSAGIIFMPLALAKKELLEGVAVVYGNRRKHQTAGIAINGFPIFYECAFMCFEDWNRAVTAINKELERRKSIEI